MISTEKIALNKARFQERKEKEFLTICPDSGKYIPVISYKKRLHNWFKLFAETRLPDCGWTVEGKGIINLFFSNGLTIIDYGNHISFSASSSKEKVNMKSALTVVKQTAKHLYQQGWKNGFMVSTLRNGGEDILATFDQAYSTLKKTIATKKMRQINQDKKAVRE